MAATGQPAEGTPAAPEPGGGESQQAETAPPAGLERIYERMDEFAGQQRQLMESVQQALTPQEEEEDEELDPADFYTETGELTEDGARALISDLVNEQVEARLAPREAQALVRERDDAYEALKDEYPGLEDEKVARETLDRAIQWANAHNPKLIERPEFVDVIEWIYRAEHGAVEQSEEEDQQRPVVLESAQGAGRQTHQPTEVDWEKRVIDAASKDGPRI